MTFVKPKTCSEPNKTHYNLRVEHLNLIIGRQPKIAVTSQCQTNSHSENIECYFQIIHFVLRIARKRLKQQVKAKHQQH